MRIAFLGNERQMDAVTASEIGRYVQEGGGIQLGKSDRPEDAVASGAKS